MKKSLLALAVLGAFAGAASAQTSVTIYGLVDASVQYIDNSAPTGSTAGKTWAVSSGQMSGSRIGFRGTEDLGGGLSAIFTLENGFNVDDGTQAQGRLFGRQAWVGLQGGFGSVKLGRQATVAYAATVAVDPFAAAASHGTQRIFGSLSREATGTNVRYNAYNSDPYLRANNTLSYTTANFSGLTGTVAYSFGETADEFATGRSVQLGLSYVNGPLNAQFAYMKSNDINVFDTSDVLQLDGDVETYLIGGSYDLGVVKPFLAFANTKFEGTAGGVAGETDVRNYLIGVSAPVGAAGTFMASWIRNDNKDVSDGEEDQFSLGYVHNLSKRTNLYTAVSFNKAQENGGVIATSDENVTRLSVGVRHSF